MYTLCHTYISEVAASDMPEDADPEEVARPFSKHACHLGLWWKKDPQIELVIHNSTHVVNSVSLNDKGGLDVKFTFINTVQGYELSKIYEESRKFRFVPVIAKNGNGIDVSRIDIVGG